MLIKQIVHGKKHNTYWGVSRFLEIMFTFGVVAVCKEWWSSDHGKLAHAMTHVDDTFKWATLSNKNSSIKVGHTKLRAPFEVSILNRRNSDIVQFGNPNIGEEEWKEKGNCFHSRSPHLARVVWALPLKCLRYPIQVSKCHIESFKNVYYYV